MRDAHPWVCHGNFARMDRTEIYNRTSLYHGAIVYMGGDVAFERSFIEAYAADLVSHSHSWCKTADSMNLRARKLNIIQVRSMYRRTIATTMLKFKLIRIRFVFRKGRGVCATWNDRFQRLGMGSVPSSVVIIHVSLVSPQNINSIVPWEVYRG